MAPVTIDIDASLPGAALDLRRYGLGQGGQTSVPVLRHHVETLKNLDPTLVRVFIQEYFNAYPARGVCDWTKLDRFLEPIIEAGGSPLMSLCLKPKVLYPVIDEKRVHPTDYVEWEDLIFRLVGHCRVERKWNITHWEVFNEPDIGEKGGSPGLFTPADYVTYYEHTVRAIRRADPGARVGGPAVASWKSPLLAALIEHCANRGVPLDFVSWHIYTDDPEQIAGTIAGVKALLAKYPCLDCETILDEWNISLRWTRIGRAFQPCFILETVSRMLENGLDRASYYQIRDCHVSRKEFAPFMSPKMAEFMAYWWNVMPQYDGLFDYQGNIRPAYFVFKLLSRLAGNRVIASSNDPDVKVLAACGPDADMLHALVWNFSLDAPPQRTVKLRVRNLPKRTWLCRRRMFDAETASNDENDRLRLVGNEIRENVAEFSETFTLPGYGIAQVLLRDLAASE